MLFGWSPGELPLRHGEEQGADGFAGAASVQELVALLPTDAAGKGGLEGALQGAVAVSTAGDSGECRSIYSF